MREKTFWFVTRWFFINPAYMLFGFYYFYLFCWQILPVDPAMMIMLVMFLISPLVDSIKILQEKNKSEYEHNTRVKKLVEARKQYDLLYEKDVNMWPPLIIMSLFFILPFFAVAYGYSIRNENSTWKALLFTPLFSFFIFNSFIYPSLKLKKITGKSYLNSVKAVLRTAQRDLFRTGAFSTKRPDKYKISVLMTVFLLALFNLASEHSLGKFFEVSVAPSSIFRLVSDFLLLHSLENLVYHFTGKTVESDADLIYLSRNPVV